MADKQNKYLQELVANQVYHEISQRDDHTWKISFERFAEEEKFCSFDQKGNLHGVSCLVPPHEKFSIFNEISLGFYWHGIQVDPLSYGVLKLGAHILQPAEYLWNKIFPENKQALTLEKVFQANGIKTQVRPTSFK